MKPTKASLPNKALFVTIIVCLALLFGLSLQSSADEYVDDDGNYEAISGSCDGTDTCFDTIQAAITAATSETVIVCPGSYTECIDMKDGVNVVNSGGVTPTISCTGDPAATVEFYPQTASMTCTLDGFEITHPSGTGAGVFLDGTLASVTATISNCSIHDIFDSAGIGMDGEVYATIQDNTIYDCGMAGIGMGGPPGGSDELSSGSSVTIKGNTIGNSANPNQEAGIFITGPVTGSASVIIGTGNSEDVNTVQYNAASGIRLQLISDLSIDNNTIENNTKAGMLLIDVGASGVGNEAVVQNNTIQSNSKAGMNIGGLSYLTVGPSNTISSNSTDGISFNMGDVEVGGGVGIAGSGPVTITGNTNINNNTLSGIGIIDPITNVVTITQNTIYSNTRGGIGIQNDCNVEIIKNTIRDNVRGGIKTGTDAADPGGFSGTAGSAILTIRQNKIYGNGASGVGGGMDVRHADGTIYNNLVYENHRGGIRYGDWIDEIVNNTVSDNGNDNGTPSNEDDDIGGGIVYDDITAGHAVNAQPTGTRAAFPIKNNIVTYNEKAGSRSGYYNTDGSEQTAYHLVYDNWGFGDCTAAPQPEFGCKKRQLGGFYNLGGTDEDVLTWADPLFVNRATDDYSLQATSPAVDAGDTSYGTDVSIPPGVGTTTIDMGAYGGPYGIDW